MDNLENKNIKYFKIGNAIFPDGKVIVSDKNGTTEYGLEEWKQNQKSQPQPQS